MAVIGLQQIVTGATFYAIFTDVDGNVWNGSAMEAYLTANLATYDVAMTERGTASRYYEMTLPALPANTYDVTIFLQAGAGPAETDDVMGTGTLSWDGSSVVVMGDILADTNEMQTDLADGGRLDVILDAILAELSITTEPGQGVPPVTTTRGVKIDYLYKAWRNKKTQTVATASLFGDDESTVDQKATIADDGTTATIGEMGTGP